MNIANLFLSAGVEGQDRLAKGRSKSFRVILWCLIKERGGRGRGIYHLLSNFRVSLFLVDALYARVGCCERGLNFGRNGLVRTKGTLSD